MNQRHCGYRLDQYQSYRGHTGIYVILNDDAKVAYVGQSVDIGIRIEQHGVELINGVHHNSRLQSLWGECRGAGFHWKVVAHAPKDLSELELRRWLADKEDETLELYKATHRVLNIAPIVVFASDDALQEYEKIQKSKDTRISAERKTLKPLIQYHEKQVSDYSQEIAALQKRMGELDREYKQHHGLLRQMFGFRINKNAIEVMASQEECAKQIKEFTQLWESEKGLLQDLKSKDRMMYGQFSKVDAHEKKKRRSVWDRPKKWESAIPREDFKILGLEESRCVVDGTISDAKMVKIRVHSRIRKTPFVWNVADLPWAGHFDSLLAIEVEVLAPEASVSFRVTFAGQEALKIHEVGLGCGIATFEFVDNQFNRILVGKS